MGSFKDRVFSEIRNDYRINRERSFLYGYILENELPEEDKNCGDAEAIDTKVRKLVFPPSLTLILTLNFMVWRPM